MPDRSDFDGVLDRELQRHAVTIDLPRELPPAVVMQRGLRRRARRRAAVSAGCLVSAAALLVGGVAVANRQAGTRTIRSGEPAADNPSPDRPEQAEPDSSAASDDPLPGEASAADNTISAVAVDPMLHWTTSEVAGDRSVSILNGPVVGSGPFYALSTGPLPLAAVTPTIYRSTDGIEWRATGSPRAEVTAISARGNGLYAIGTAPGTKFDVELSHSPDGGETWDAPTPLPLGLAELAASDGVTGLTAGTAAFALPTGISVVSQVNLIIDYAKVLPDAGLVDRAEIVEGGVMTYEPPALVPCADVPDVSMSTEASPPATDALATASGCRSDVPPPSTLHGWDELQLPAAALAALRHPVRTWFSTDGRTFEQTGRHFVGSPEYLDPGTATMFPDGGAGVLVQGLGVDGAVLTTDDGRTWSTLTLPPPTTPGRIGYEATGLARSRGVLAVSGRAYGPARQFAIISVSSDDGATWQHVDMATLASDADGPVDFDLRPIVGNDDGFVVTGPAFLDFSRPTVGETWERDGYTLRRVAMRYTVFDPNGELIADAAMTDLPTESMRSDDGSGALVVSVDGVDVVSFTFEELAAAAEARTKQWQPDGPWILVAHSRDGLHWSRQRLEDRADLRVLGESHHAIALSDRVIVTAARDPLVPTEVDGSPTDSPSEPRSASAPLTPTERPTVAAVGRLPT